MKILKPLFITCFMLVSSVAISQPNFDMVGFATQNGGTTGGQGGQTVIVNNYNDLKSYAESSTPYIIMVQGTITNGSGGGQVNVQSNKSIIGVGDNAFLSGVGLALGGPDNIIIQNLKISLIGVTTPKNLNDGDCISISGTSRNIWIDHCELFSEDPNQQTDIDKYDGLIDIKGQTGFITISWCYLHDHHKGGLVGAGDSDLYGDRKVTFHHNYYNKVKLRVPMYRGATGHFFNNYVKDAQKASEIRAGTCLRVEKNYYENFSEFAIYTTSDSPGNTQRIDNYLSKNQSRSFPSNCTANIPYDYSAVLTSNPQDVPGIVMEYAGVGKLDATVTPVPPFTVASGMFNQGSTDNLGLPLAPNAETVTVFSPNANTDKFSNGVVMVGYKGMLYCQWQSSAQDEDSDDTWVAYSRSSDGVNWTAPMVLQATTTDGHCTSGGWWVSGDELIAYINVWPDAASPRGGNTYFKSTTDGLNWTAMAPVKMANGSNMSAVFEQDPHALPDGRIINAAHFQPGIIANPIYTDDPRGVTGWVKASYTNLDYSGDVSREIEPSWFWQNDGDVVMTFRDQNGTNKRWAAKSTDRGETWTMAVETDMPDSRSKQSAGNLQDETAYLVGNPVNENRRYPLAITLSAEGEHFDQSYFLRAGGSDLQAQRYTGQYKTLGYSYPKSMVWKGYLYVSYSTNKEDVQYTRIPVGDISLNNPCVGGFIDDCGFCSGGSTGVEACAGAIQGEEYCSANGVLETSNQGYVGEGYLNFTNETGADGMWTIVAEAAGMYTLGVKYANGGGAARGMSVAINGSNAGNFTANPTGGWTSWVTEDITVTLVQGVNTLEMVAITDDGGPNVDLIAFNSDELSEGSCSEDCNGIFGGTAYLDNCNTCVGGTTGKEPCTQDCEGNWGGSAVLDNCGKCTGGSTGNIACTTSLQAEAACQHDGTVDDNNVGFHGDGFINTPNEVGTSIMLSINADTEMTTSIGFVYANGGATDRSATVILNGTTTGTLTFSTTGDWELWESENMSLSLKQGSNIIQLVATTTGGIPNLDQLNIYETGIGQGSCAADCHGDLGGTAAYDACNECTGGNTGLDPVTNPDQCIATGIDTLSNVDIRIYPNPSEGLVYFTKECEWELYSPLGEKVQSGRGTSVDLSAHTPGVYLLKVKGGANYKILKN